jgi:hypothetical protein
MDAKNKETHPRQRIASGGFLRTSARSWDGKSSSLFNKNRGIPVSTSLNETIE